MCLPATHPAALDIDDTPWDVNVYGPEVSVSTKLARGLEFTGGDDVYSDFTPYQARRLAEALTQAADEADEFVARHELAHTADAQPAEAPATA